MTWVHDQIYAAGGTHIPMTWADFADQTGVSAILHINPNEPDRFRGPAADQFLWMDVADESQAGLDERRQAAIFLDSCVTGGFRILLHSSLGFHRTRWAYVAYTICAGRSVRAALRSAAEPPWLAPYSTDHEMWNEFAAVCRAESICD